MQDIDPRERPLMAITDNNQEWVTVHLQSKETLDKVFEHRAVVLAKQLDSVAVLGQGITFCYQPTKASSRVYERLFHGYCMRIRQMGILASHGYEQYEITAVSWLWFLQQRMNCRIFQQQKTSEIVQTICREHGFHTFLELKVTGDKSREYCVQFNESDLGFLSRLLEDEGWFYFFRQEKGKHCLIIGDNNRVFDRCCEEGLEYFVGSSKLDSAITGWVHGYQMQPGSCTTADYSVELAQSMISDDARSGQNHGRVKQLNRYYYPGRFNEKSEAHTCASRTMAALDARFSQVEGSSTQCHFAAGTTFQLAHHPDSTEQQNYLLSSVEHTLIAAEDGLALEYRNTFRCLPLKTPWLPVHSHGKPKLSGLQSARVTGAGDKEIHTDKYHRIKLLFHWNRTGLDDENSSCWVRVAQPVAGDGFGCQFTPRVGDEVLVSFLNEDPDQPLVVGAVYNGTHGQPCDSETRQGIKLKSTPGASSDNFSELSFECRKDEEKLFLQAEKDMALLVKNDRVNTIKGNDKVEIEKSSQRTVKENDHQKIEGEQSIEVSKDINVKTEADYKVDISGNYQQITEGDSKLTVKGAARSESTDDMSQESKAGYSAKAANTMTLDATSIIGSGKSSIEMSVGGSKVILSSSAVEISCGPSTVKLSASGVEISGMQVKVEGQVKAEIKGGVSASLEGTAKADVKGTLVTVNGHAMTSIKAGAMVEVSGAIAKIN